MDPSPRVERRKLLAALGAGLLVAMAALTWAALAPRDSRTRPVREYEVQSRPAGPDRAQPAALLAERLESALRAPKADLPKAGGRSPLAGKDSTRQTIEILVRTEEDAVPMAHCEVLYIDAGGEAEFEMSQLIKRRGLDMGEIRRVGNHALTDDAGRVRLPCTGSRIYAMALSETRAGLESFDTDPATQGRVIDCSPICFVRAQVVDVHGRPQRGIPVCVTRKHAGLFEVDSTGTTRGADAIAELGPIENDENEVLVLRIAGVLCAGAEVEVEPKSLPRQPIRLVLPAHGSLEVRLVEADGTRFAGEAEVELGACDGADDSVPARSERVTIRSGSALFENVGLGLELQAAVSIPGHDLTYAVRGPGPRSEGEKALLELRLGSSSLTLTGRALDVEHRPMRFRELRLVGAIERPQGALQFSRQAGSDAVGNFAVQFDNCELERGMATLLIVHESEPHALGAVKSLAVQRGSNELGAWILAPAELLASGRVVDSFGAFSPGAHIELVNPERALGIGWAEPAQSDEQARFELRGWSSETTLSILAGARGAKQREPIAVAKGSTDVLLSRPGPKN